jgi:hypothetical protein
MPTKMILTGDVNLMNTVLARPSRVPRRRHRLFESGKEMPELTTHPSLCEDKGCAGGEQLAKFLVFFPLAFRVLRVAGCDRFYIEIVLLIAIAHQKVDRLSGQCYGRLISQRKMGGELLAKQFDRDTNFIVALHNRRGITQRSSCRIIGQVKRKTRSMW